MENQRWPSRSLSSILWRMGLDPAILLRKVQMEPEGMTTLPRLGMKRRMRMTTMKMMRMTKKRRRKRRMKALTHPLMCHVRYFQVSHLLDIHLLPFIGND